MIREISILIPNNGRGYKVHVEDVKSILTYSFLFFVFFLLFLFIFSVYSQFGSLEESLDYVFQPEESLFIVYLLIINKLATRDFGVDKGVESKKV
jgi:hypothetical protein